MSAHDHTDNPIEHDMMGASSAAAGRPLPHTLVSDRKVVPLHLRCASDGSARRMNFSITERRRPAVPNVRQSAANSSS